MEVHPGGNRTSRDALGHGAGGLSQTAHFFLNSISAIVGSPLTPAP